jgi:hypothetical protein
LAEALNGLVDDQELRAEMGAAGRARALDLYDESKVLTRTLDLLGVADQNASRGGESASATKQAATSCPISSPSNAR